MSPECTSACCSQQHGSQITAAIVRGTEVQAIAYMKNLCRRCYFVTDKSGKSALHTAASCGKRKVVRWLLAQGASLNQPDLESGYTPLHRAMFYGHLHVACGLIEAGANIFVHDYDALTALNHVNIDRPSYVTFSQSLPTHLYVWGSNNNYNLGFISRNAKETPDCLDTLQREGLMIKDVVMEKFHTLFLTTKGHVYVCGHGNGGRLGLANHTTAMTPRMIKTFVHITITKVSVGTDHSLFLSDSGQVWSCGTNRYHQLGMNPPVEELNVPQVLTWHKTHKDECIEGIGAARYHSVMWTSKSLYTFGLNGGQLGQMKNQMEQTIIMPRMVTSISLKEKGHITCVAVSDGATVVCTSFGDVYLLYQYQTRRIGFKMHNILKVACVGGWLDSNLIVEKRTEKNSSDLKILVLTGEGNNNLYLWTESLSQMSRCLYDIEREISVVDVCLSTHMVGLVTKEGEAFAAEIIPPKKQSSPDKPFKKSSTQLVKFLDRSTCVFLHLTHIAGLHRAISIKCDPKGLNFAAIQNEPKCYLTDLPEVGPSSFKKDLTTLFLDTNEMDSICDVVISCGTKNFFAHSYILACHSQYFKDKLLNCPKENIKYPSSYLSLPGEKAKKMIAIPDVDPEIFQEILTYIYTGSCQLLVEESERILNGDDNSCFGKKSMQDKENFSNPHEDKYSNKNKKKRKQRLSESKYPDENSSMRGPINTILTAARTYGLKSLERDIKNMLNLNGSFIINEREKRDNEGKFLYSRKACQELWDVMITSGTGDKLGAHKCILSARLEYFNCMFGACWIEATSSKSLSMPLPTNVLATILDYLYEDDSAKLRQCREPEFICNVLAVAEQFLMNRLREICEVVLAGLITLKNAAELLEFACTYRADQLKKSVMQFICLNLSAILENGSLLTISSSDILLELSLYYRKFIPQISYRVLTPHDQPPYADELEKLLEQNPYVLPGSDEEWEDESLAKDKYNRNNSQGSSRKTKRKHRNSQGDTRTRKTSTSSQLSVGSSSDCESLKDLEQEFEALDFDDLEERSPEDIGKALPSFESQASNCELIIPKNEKSTHRKNSKENASWQKVGKKKNESVQPSHEEFISKEIVKKETISNDLPQSEKVSQTQPIPVSPKVEASPRNDFPSLSDSFSFSPRNSSAPRSNKMGKKSEKQWKKINLNDLDQIDAVEEVAKKKASGATSPSVQLPAWGANKDVSKVHNLADIMKSEETSVKVKNRKTSAPIPIQKGKNSSQMTTSVKTPTPVKKGWGVTDPIADERKRLDSEGNGPLSLNATSPPTSPLANSSLTSPGHSFCEEAEFSPRKKGFRVPNFSNILQEEQIRTVNLKKERQKTLGQIQIEDRAIEELLMFYGAGESIDEKITVSRMRIVVGNPVWK